MGWFNTRGNGKKSISGNENSKTVATPSCGKPASIYALEPRILFDAAAVQTMADAVVDATAAQADVAIAGLNAEGQDADHSAEGTDSGHAGDDLPGAAATYDEEQAGSDNADNADAQVVAHSADDEDDATPADPSTPESDEITEVVIIDNTIENIDDITTSIGENADVYILEEGDGIEEMADILASYENLDAVHIMSHGGPGAIHIGADTLDADSITTEYADELAVIGESLSDDGDILIYGCNVAMGDTGGELVSLLAEATGADVAASSDDTGAADHGGDWDLEVTDGTIETAAIAATAWDGIMADADGDGIDDAIDIDDDGDGILDAIENADGTWSQEYYKSSGYAIGMTFSSDGQYVYIIEAGTNEILQYSLGTAWDLSSAFTYETSESIGYASCNDVTFSSDESVLYVISRDSNVVVAYTLNTPGNLSGGVASTVTFNTGLSDIEDALFSDDGQTMYVLDDGTDTIYVYDLGTNGLDTGDTYDSAKTITLETYSGAYTSMEFSEDGTRLLILRYEGTTGEVISYALDTPYTITSTDVSTTAAYNTVLEVTGFTGQMLSLACGADTANYYVCSYHNSAAGGFYHYAAYADTDGDGIINSLDIDSDNDGITDLIEAQGVNYTAPSGADVDLDGLDDAFETGGLTPVDTDGDGAYDYTDTDSDDNGILDLVEAQTGPSYVDWSGVDSDGDGLDDAFDSDDTQLAGSTGITPLDTDGEGVADYIDIDNDKDGILDTTEITSTETVAITEVAYAELAAQIAPLVSGSTNFEIGGLTFSADGKYIYITDKHNVTTTDDGSRNDGLYQVTLNTAWDLSDGIDTSAGSKFLDAWFGGNASTRLGSTTGITFSSDGTQLFVVDAYEERLTQFTLSTAWDISTGTRVSTIDLDDSGYYSDSDLTTEVGVHDLAFSSDGNTVYLLVCFDSATKIYQFSTTSTEAYDITSGISLISSISLPDPDDDGTWDNTYTATGMCLSNDGTRLYVTRYDESTGDSSLIVYNVTYGTGSEIASLAVNRGMDPDGSVELAQSYVSGITFSPDEISMYLSTDNSNSSSVYEYIGAHIGNDTDGDGIADYRDIDSDNDGIVDTIEAGGTVAASTTDNDKDGLLDAYDQAVGDTSAAASIGLTPMDSDGDGFNDYLDIDSDNDGIIDLTEALGNRTVAASGDGDGDGMDDAYESLTPADTDGDLTADYLDLDSDNNDVTDNVEAQTGAASVITASGVDSDGDGLDDAFGTGLTPTDIDNDGVADYIDIDNDGDGITDVTENTWDITGAVLDGTATFTGIELQDAVVSGNGEYLYYFNNNGASNSIVIQYRLTTPYDIDGGMTLVTSFNFESTSLSVDSVSDMAFSSDGTKLYLLKRVSEGGTIERTVVEVRLTEAWNLDSIDESTLYELSITNNGPMGMTLSTDGHYLYITGTDETVLQYYLSTAYGLTSASYQATTSLTNSTDVGGIAFNAGGTMLYVASLNGTVQAYSLATAWDTSAMTYVSSFTTAASSYCTGIDIVTSGSTVNIYIADNNGTTKAVYQYTVESIDTDGDGVFDMNDIDSDDDGITDLIEAQGTAFVAPLGTDSDKDGLDDQYDNNTSSTTIADSLGLTPIDTDGDGTADYLDLDSDADGIIDLAEQLAGMTAAGPSGIDSDGDGLDDTFDADTSSGSALDSAITSSDTDGDGVANYLDIDDDGDGILTTTEIAAMTWELDYARAATDPSAVTFSSDGMHCYIVNSNSEKIDQWDLTTAFDLSTASYVRAISASDTSANDIWFSSDGLTIYVAGKTNGRIYQKTLDTAWNIASVSATTFFDTGLGATDYVEDLLFSNDGSLMYVLNANDDQVLVYNLGTAWNVTSAVFNTTISMETSSTGTYMGMDFNFDGTQLYVLLYDGSSASEIISFDLTSAFAITAGDLDSSTGTLFSAIPGWGHSFCFNTDFTNVYIASFNKDTVYQYTLDTDGDNISDYLDIDSDNDGINDLVEAMGNTPVAASGDADKDGLDDAYGAGLTPADNDGDLIANYMDIDSDGDGALDIVEAQAGSAYTALSGTDADGDGLDDAFDDDAADTALTASNGLTPGNTDGDLAADYLDIDDDGDGILTSVENDAATLTLADTITYSYQPTGITFSSDGLYCYIVNTSNDTVIQYRLTTPFDLTAGTTQLTSVAAGDNSANDILFSSDGTTMYIVGKGNGAIRQFILATAWDLSTVASNRVVVFDTWGGGAIEDVLFSNDGTIMYVLNTNTNAIQSFTLAMAWDVSSATAAATVSFGTGTTYMAMEFSSDGSALYVLTHNSTSNLIRFDLATPFTITAGDLNTPTDTLLSAITGWGHSLCLSGDGTSIYVVVYNTDTVYRYTFDTDADGITDALDIDSDNDGITDGIEAQGAGYTAASGTDIDRDGLDDDYDDDTASTTVAASNGLTAVDTDSDGVADYRDLDSDNDGITDNVEAQATGAYVAATGIDSDGDGLDDAYDTISGYNAFGGLSPVDSESDGIFDYLDTDSDNDGILDAAESGITLNTAGATDDTDGDGLLDLYEGANLSDGYNIYDENVTLSGTTLTAYNLAKPVNLNADGSNVVTIADGAAYTLDLDFRDINDAPVTVDDTATVLEDGTVEINVAANDSDYEGELDATSVVLWDGSSEVTTLTEAGVGEWTVDTVTGLITFVPVANYCGAVSSVTYRIYDSDGAYSTATVTATITPVNDEPGGTDNTITVLEDGSYTFSAADFGFQNPEPVDGNSDGGSANALAAVIITTLPDSAVGTLKFNGSAVTAGQQIDIAQIGLLVFTPAADVNGTTTNAFTFQVVDDGGTANSGVNTDQTPNNMSITITSVNDEPAGADNTIIISEDATYSLTEADFGFTDAIDGNSLSAVLITTLPTGGTLVIYDGSTTTTLNAGDTVLLADITAGYLQFTPTLNLNGTAAASFTFQVVDDGGTTNGGVDTDQTANTITFDIAAVNDAPEGTDTTITIDEDTAYTLAKADFGFTDPVEGDNLSEVIITTLPSGGTLTLNGSAVSATDHIAVTDITSGLLVYTPAADANGVGADAFTFQVVDDGGTTGGTTGSEGVDTDASANTITISITAVNDAPVLADDSFTVDEDNAATINLTDNFTDVEDGTTFDYTTIRLYRAATNTWVTSLTVAGEGLWSVNTTTGVVTFTPEANYNGTVTPVTFRAADSQGEFATAQITGTVNPVADGVTLTDLSGPTVEESDLSSGTTPDEDGETATGYFTVTADDGLASVTIGGTTFTLAELESATEASPLTTVSTTYGEITVTGYDSATGRVSYSYILTTNALVTTDTIAVSALDSLSGSDSANLIITIADDGPAADNDACDMINQDGKPNNTASGNVLTNDDFGADGPAATTVTNAGTHTLTYGTLVIDADGNYTYTPDYTNGTVAALGPNQTVTDTFTYTIEDADGTTHTAELASTIRGVPALLELTDNGTYTSDGFVEEVNFSSGESTTGTFYAIVKDGSSFTLTISGTGYTEQQIIDGISNGTPVTVTTANGTLELTAYDAATSLVTYQYTLDALADHSGVDEVTTFFKDNFTLRLTDDDGDYSDGTLSIAILDDAPTVADDTNAVTEDVTTPITGNVAANDTVGADATGSPVSQVTVGTDTSSMTAVDPVSGVTVTGTYGDLAINGDGSYAYTLDNSSALVQGLQAGETATEVFTYQIEDTDGSFDTATLTITITGATETITADSAVQNTDGTVTIGGSGDPGATVDVTFEDGSIQSVTVAADGTWSATSVDPQTTGDISITQTDSQSATQDITYTFTDSTAPATPVIDSVTANIDGTLTVAGTGEPGSTVTVTFPDGTTKDITLPYDGDGSYSLTSDAPQTDGTVSVSQTDEAGNDSGTATDSYTDVAAPLAPVISTADQNSDGTITVTGTGEAGATVEVTFEDGTTATAVVDENGDWSLTSNTPQTSGDITATQTDDAGWESPSDTYNFTDLVEPAAPTVNQPIPQNSDGTLTVSGIGEAGSTVIVTFPDGSTGTVVVGDDGTYSVTSTTPQDSGNVVVSQTDEAGNSSTDTTVAFADNTVPDVPTINTPSQDAAGLLTVTGTGEPGATVTVTFPDGTTGTATVAADGSYTVTSTTPQTSGTVTASQTDAAGNESGTETFDYTDITRPATPVIDGTTPAQNDDGTLTVSGTGEAGATVEVTYPDGTTETVVVGDDGTWTLTSDTPQGSGTVTVSQTDEAGNACLTDASATFTDTNPPVEPGVNEPTQNADDTLTVTGTGEPGATVNVTFPSGETGTAIVGADGTWSATSLIPQTTGDVTVTQTDAAGNTSPAVVEDFVDNLVDQNLDGTLTVTGAGTPGTEVTVTFPDGTSMVVLVAADGTWSATSLTPQTTGDVELSYTDVDGDPASETLTFTDNNAPDVPGVNTPVQNNDGTLTVTGTGEAGSTVTVEFPDGSTGTVTVAADGTWSITSDDPQTSGEVSASQTDEAGNTSGTGHVTFTDGTAPDTPVVDTPAQNADGTLTVNGTGEAGSTVTVEFPDGSTGTVVVADDGTWSITSDDPQTSGTVSVSQTDEAGNTSGTNDVDYVDTTAPAVPVVNTPVPNVDGTLTVSGTGEAGSTVTVEFPDGSTVTVVVADDGTWSVTSDDPQTSGTVTASQTDDAGNTSSEVDVTFTDGTAPATPDVNTPVQNSDGTLTVSGTGEAGSTVTVEFPDGSTGTVVVADDGTYAVTSDDPQTSGTVSVFQTDEAGNTSGTEQVAFTDGTAPDVPDVNTPVQNSDGTLTVSGTGEAGSTVTVEFPDGSTGTVVVADDGTYAVTSDDPQTSGTVSVSQTDEAGNTSGTEQVTFTDSTDPANPVVNAPVPNSDGTLTVSGTGEAGSTITVEFPDGSTGTVEVGADGTYSVTSDTPQTSGTVTVSQTDEAGNTSGDVDVSFTDTSPPETPVVNTPYQNYINDTLTVSGTGEAGSTITVTFADGTTETVVVADDGTWSVTSNDAQTSGDVTVSQTDAAGNTSGTATAAFVDNTVQQNPDGTLTVIGGNETPGATINVTMPDGTIVSATVEADGTWSATSAAPQTSGTVFIDGVAVADETLTFTDNTAPATPTVNTPASQADGTLTISGTGEAGSTVTVEFPDGSTGTAVVDSSGNYTVTSDTPQTSGTVSVSQTDEAGNTSGTEQLAYTDGTAPADPVVDAPVQNTDGTLTVSGTGEAGSTVTVEFPDGSTGTAVVACDGTYAVTSDDPQTSGDVTVSQTDEAGNTSGEVDATFADSTAPADPVVNEPIPQNTDGTLTVSGTGEPGSTVTVEFPDGSTGTAVVAGDGTYSVTSDDPQTSGTVSVSQTDQANNTSGTEQVTFTDTTAPATPVVDAPVPNADGTLTVSGTGEAGSTVTVEFPDGSTGTVVVAANGTWSITSDDPQTSGTVSVSQEDTAGNTSGTNDIDYADTTAPTAPVVNAPAPNSDGTLTVSGTGEPGSTVTVTFPDGSTGTVVVAADGAYSVTSDTPQTSGTVTVSQTDEAGNSSSGTDVTFTDTTPPETPVVNEPIPQNADGTLTVSGTGEPGSEVSVTFPDGSTGTVEVGADGTWSITSDDPQTTGTVTVLQTDEAGNPSASDAIGFVDETAPSVPGNIAIAPEDDGTITVSGEGEPGSEVTVTFPDGSTGTVSVGADGTWSITSDVPQPEGDVGASQTDAAGNQSGTGVIEYGDMIAPLTPTLDSNMPVQNEDGTLTVSGEGEAGATVTVVFPDGSTGTALVADDGTWSIASDDPQTSGTLILSQTDPAGNTSDSSEIDYVDTTPPATPGIGDVVQNADGTISVSGEGEPGSTVTVTFPDGSTGTSLVDANGNYGPITSDTPQTSGDITVVQEDAAGNVSDTQQQTYTDVTPPEAPSIGAITTNPDGTISVSGGGEPGSTVTVSFPDGSIGTAVVDENGSYTVTSAEPQGDGEITVIQTDAAGNVSDPTSESFAGALPHFDMNALLGTPPPFGGPWSGAGESPPSFASADAGEGLSTDSIADDGVILTTVNRADNLNGIRAINRKFDNPWQVNDPGYDAHPSFVQVGNKGGMMSWGGKHFSEDGSQSFDGAFVVETMFDNDMAYINIHFTEENSDRRFLFEEIQATMADGRALPRWISICGDGSIVAHAPAGIEEFALRVTCTTKDGGYIVQTFAVDTITGEITAIENEPVNLGRDDFSSAIEQFAMALNRQEMGG